MMTRIVIVLINVLYSILLISQNAITISKFIGGVSIPVDIDNCGDERLFIIEKTGKIRVVENNLLVVAPFLDIVSKVRSSGNEHPSSHFERARTRRLKGFRHELPREVVEVSHIYNQTRASQCKQRT